MMFISADTVPQWVSDSFPWIRLVMMILMVLLSIFMIVSVMTQPSASEGLSAIGGGQDTFFGKHKGKTFEGTMKKITVIVAICLLVICILFYGSLLIYNGNL